MVVFFVFVFFIVFLYYFLVGVDYFDDSLDFSDEPPRVPWVPPVVTVDIIL